MEPLISPHIQPKVSRRKVTAQQANALGLVTLRFLPNTSDREDTMQIVLRPLGLEDIVVIEGRLDKTQIYVNINDALVPGYAYSVDQTVFLLSPTDLDGWFTDELAEHGQISHWGAHWCQPVWFDFSTLWGNLFGLSIGLIEVPYIEIYGAVRLRHSGYGRTINLNSLLLEPYP